MEKQHYILRFSLQVHLVYTYIRFGISVARRVGNPGLYFNYTKTHSNKSWNLRDNAVFKARTTCNNTKLRARNKQPVAVQWLSKTSRKTQRRRRFI